jgi:hypothetical protein
MLRAYARLDQLAILRSLTNSQITGVHGSFLAAFCSPVASSELERLALLWTLSFSQVYITTFPFLGLGCCEDHS